MKKHDNCKRTKIPLLLRFCWLLEDIADIVTLRNADWFYPSNFFEKKYFDKTREKEVKDEMPDA